MQPNNQSNGNDLNINERFRFTNDYEGIVFNNEILIIGENINGLSTFAFLNSEE